MKKILGRYTDLNGEQFQLARDDEKNCFSVGIKLDFEKDYGDQRMAGSSGDILTKITTVLHMNSKNRSQPKSPTPFGYNDDAHFQKSIRVFNAISNGSAPAVQPEEIPDDIIPCDSPQLGALYVPDKEPERFFWVDAKSPPSIAALKGAIHWFEKKAGIPIDQAIKDGMIATAETQLPALSGKVTHVSVESHAKAPAPSVEVA